MFKVTAYWKEAIRNEDSTYSIFEINRKYYIRMGSSNTASMVEGHLNFEKGFYSICLKKYTRERITKEGDPNGVIAIIDSTKPTWKQTLPKCECGVWLVGGIHSSWCPRKKYEENT